MILSSLVDYYNSRYQNPNSDMPVLGFSKEKISFCISLDENGILHNVIDLRKRDNKKIFTETFIVPQIAGVKTNKIIPSFLWGDSAYLLGFNSKKKPERVLNSFLAFRNICHEIGDDLNYKGMKAVLKFLDNWNPSMMETLEFWEEIDKGGNLIFALEGETIYVHEHKEVSDAWISYYVKNDNPIYGNCLISGNYEPISRVHPKIKNVNGAQSSGASIVSFNKDAFNSYGKLQGENAPIGEKSVFAYTTALNSLLRRENGHRIQIGDTTTVFWTEEVSEIENVLCIMFDPSMGTNKSNELKLFLEAIRDGKKPNFNQDEMEHNKFFILGLSPNSGRISVRFWHCNTVDNICKLVGQHFAQMQINQNNKNESEFLSLFDILCETAQQGKSENIIPSLSGALINSILTGQPYPENLLTLILDRIRVNYDNGQKKTVTYKQAAIIKAFLIRNAKKEIPMSLNPDLDNIGYQLGRLFATLEKLQIDANPGRNSTIRESYYGSAPDNPSIIFEQLMKMLPVYIGKSKYGFFSDKRIEEIMCKINKFPTNLNSNDKGMFHIGYYHQKNKMYERKSTEIKIEVDNQMNVCNYVNESNEGEI